MQNLDLITDAAADTGKPKTERISSTIQFPYTDMADAIAVAEGMMKGGGIGLSRDQLAAAMGLAPGGGGFATKIATARMFGIIEAAAGKYELTDIGHEILDQTRSSGAKVNAFLKVDLYRKAYDEFKGRLLPPKPHGIEAAFIKFGVSQKTVRAARLAFDKSARLAGFFPNANEDRLVLPFGAANLPVVVPDAEHEDKPEQPNQRREVPERQKLGSDVHPAIAGLLDELPPSKTTWTIAEQADWLTALATVFRVVYKNDDRGSIKVEYAPGNSS